MTEVKIVKGELLILINEFIEYSFDVESLHYITIQYHNGEVDTIDPTNLASSYEPFDIVRIKWI